MRYSPEKKVDARRLFVEEGMTYDDVHLETGISLSSLKQWGGEGNWLKGQKEFEAEYLELSGAVHKLSLRMARKAMETGHSQDALAFANVFRSIPRRRGSNQFDKAAFFIEVMTSLFNFLKVRDPEALKALEPQIAAFAEEFNSSEAA